jgi:uncharacterized protein with gpF-like domain
MRPWEQFRMMPDATAIFSTQPQWDAEVDTILTEVGRISLDAWSQASDVPPVSRHAFVMAQLAMTQNFLVRIPDETYSLVFAEITDGTNAGENVEQVARRVDRVLTYTGSERWPSRARTIAQTETTRAYGAATVAAGMEQSRVTGRMLRKKWISHRDERTRISHAGANEQTQHLIYPFIVGGEPLQFPGDPMGSPENVINCRCKAVITNE